MSSSISSTGPRLPRQTQLIAGSLFGFWVTLEFKNNLDGLIDDVDGESPKKFTNINICVCWSSVASSFKGYQVEEVEQRNLEERQYPGITHLLRKDGEGHVMQVIMLGRVVDMINAGNLKLSGV